MWRDVLTPLPEAPCQAPPPVSSAPAFLPQLFHEAAYQADDRQDLLSAISEFLDGSIVIPPSEVEGRDLLRSVAAFQRELLRKRREREQNKVEMTTRGGYVAPGKGQALGDPEPPMLPHTAKSMTSAPSCLPESRMQLPTPDPGLCPWARPGRMEEWSVFQQPLVPQDCRWKWGALR